ncbi:MAG TPA: hypothetical protein VIO38_08105, partial [Rariglobus sp.]
MVYPFIGANRAYLVAGPGADAPDAPPTLVMGVTVFPNANRQMGYTYEVTRMTTPRLRPVPRGNTPAAILPYRATIESLLNRLATPLVPVGERVVPTEALNRASAQRLFASLNDLYDAGRESNAVPASVVEAISAGLKRRHPEVGLGEVDTAF